MTTITGVAVHDVRFPTAAAGDGSDSINRGDYSATYVELLTGDGPTAGGRTADGETADGETADGETADGETADDRAADEPTSALPAGEPPAWAGAPRPVVPSLRGEEEGNPFANEDDFKTVADVIPASPEASRSLQSEPSWTVARQSAALGELQRWVQESRTPPQTRWEAVGNEVRPLHQRVTAWAQQRGLPRWSPYASVAVVIVWFVVLLVKCTGGHAAKKAPAPAESRTAPAADRPSAGADEAPSRR